MDWWFVRNWMAKSKGQNIVIHARRQSPSYNQQWRNSSTENVVTVQAMLSRFKLCYHGSCWSLIDFTAVRLFSLNEFN